MINLSFFTWILDDSLFMKFFYVFRYKTRSIWVNTNYALGMTSGVAATECFSALLVFPRQIQGLRAQENLKRYGTFKASYLTGYSALSSGVLMQTKHSQWDNNAVLTGTVKTIWYKEAHIHTGRLFYCGLCAVGRKINRDWEG